MEELYDMVRVGNVMAVNPEELTCRVKFPDVDYTSDWLSVVQRPGTAVAVSPADHTHEKSFCQMWMPKVNDPVLCIYRKTFTGDEGYVIGGIV